MKTTMTFNNVAKRLTRGAVLALAVVGQIAWAQVSGLAKRVDIFLKDADLLQATQMLTRQTGLQFVIAPSQTPYEKVNLSLSGVTAEEAIKYICEAAGCWAERDENGVFVIRAGQRPARLANNPSGSAIKRPMKIERIKIMNADVRHVYEAIFQGIALDPDRGLKEVNTFQIDQRGTTQIPTSQVMIGAGGSAVMSPGNALPVKGDKGTLPTDSGSFQNSGNDIQLPGETANQVRGGGGGGNGGGGGGAGLGGGGGGGNTGQGGGAIQAGTGFAPDGLQRVTYDPSDNSLIVQGDDEAIQQLRQLVAMFDTVPKQVIIKVEFITTSQSVARSLGMDWLYQRGAVNAGNRPGTFARVGDPIFINYATGNITTRLRTILSDGQGKVVNAPLIRTLNNQTAFVTQQNQTTIFLNQTINGAGGIQTNSVPQQITINTGLVVRPRINDDGYVTMYLNPTIADFGQLKRGPDGQEIPDILTQTIGVVARVKSGQTIALGGLTRKATTTSTSRFPILSDLPIIGQLFRSSNTQRSDSELLIFVTPIVVEDDQMGGLAP